MPPVVVVGFAVVSGLIPLRFRPLPVLVDVPVPRPVPVPKLELELGKPKLNPLDILTFYYLLSKRDLEFENFKSNLRFLIAKFNKITYNNYYI